MPELGTLRSRECSMVRVSFQIFTTEGIQPTLPRSDSSRPKDTGAHSQHREGSQREHRRRRCRTIADCLSKQYWRAIHRRADSSRKKLQKLTVRGDTGNGRFDTSLPSNEENDEIYPKEHALTSQEPATTDQAVFLDQALGHFACSQRTSKPAIREVIDRCAICSGSGKAFVLQLSGSIWLGFRGSWLFFGRTAS